jgi:hypothetical protein
VSAPGATPPLEPLREVVELLAAGGIRCALGASGLLHALGLADHVGDWDLTTDEPIERVRPLLAGLAPEHVGPSGIHADQKLVTHDGQVELIVRMALVTEGGVCRIPARVSGEWRGIPLASAEVWGAAYTLLGRAGKADRLFAHLSERGADRGALAEILKQPLPESLSRRLRALPAR